jgi:hypothetical protein
MEHLSDEYKIREYITRLSYQVNAISPNLPTHLPQQLIQRLEQTKPIPQITADSPRKDPPVHRPLADEVDILAAMPLLQILRQGRVERAFVAVALQGKGILFAERSRDLFEFSRFGFDEAPQVIHGFPGSAVKTHAVAIAVGADLEEETGGGFPVRTPPLEGDPETGLVGGFVAGKTGVAVNAGDGFVHRRDGNQLGIDCQHRP